MTRTRCRMELVAGLSAVLLASGAAWAQEEAPAGEDSLELTMTLLPENAIAADVLTRTIELPAAAALRAVEASAGGVEVANEARERREVGPETAAEARERGREFGQDVAEQARENAGRGSDGAGPPDLPNVPAIPGRPGPNPPGPNPPGPNPPGPNPPGPNPPGPNPPGQASPPGR
jgi:hypothetical protein